mmetsp:Transcript_58627/g.186860  ORF Transcript_58627/g.186860 Transcript_58627/m.186860 type:complete len:200 (-) Transcript_58627:33-632(-)
MATPPVHIRRGRTQRASAPNKWGEEGGLPVTLGHTQQQQRSSGAAFGDGDGDGVRPRGVGAGAHEEEILVLFLFLDCGVDSVGDGIDVRARGELHVHVPLEALDAILDGGVREQLAIVVRAVDLGHLVDEDVLFGNGVAVGREDAHLGVDHAVIGLDVDALDLDPRRQAPIGYAVCGCVGAGREERDGREEEDGTHRIG